MRAFGPGLSLVLLFSGCAHPPATKPFSAPAETHATGTRSEGDLAFAQTASDAERKAGQIGLATWYGAAFAGKKTSSGERFDPNAMTAAHRKLPFGTWVEVRRVDTGTSVRVRITDRGPWGHEDRIIDLSRAAAERIGLVKERLVKVELRVVAGPE
jgi:rare lipoprotein A